MRWTATNCADLKVVEPANKRGGFLFDVRFSRLFHRRLKFVQEIRKGWAPHLPSAQPQFWRCSLVHLHGNFHEWSYGAPYARQQHLRIPQT